MRWKPVREIQNHAGEEPGLRDAEQQPHGVKLTRGVHQGGTARNDPPGHQHPADPDPRAHLVGHLENEVSQKENACAEAINAVAELQVAQHLQFGKAHIHPIDVGDDVADKHDRHNSPRNLAIQRIVHADRGRFWRGVTCW